MFVTSSFFKFARILVLLLPVLAARAQEATGAVSSSPKPPAPAATSAGTSETKSLPWKFLASPMGALDSATYGPVINTLAGCTDPKTPVPSEAVHKLLAATIGDKVTNSKAQYLVIHVVDPTTPPNGADAWYLYRSAKGNWGDTKWDCQKFTGQRIFGASSVVFLFAHLHAKGVTLESARQQVKQLLTTAKTSADTGPLTASLRLVPAGISDSELENALKTNSLVAPGAAFANMTFCDKDSGDHFLWFLNSAVPTTLAKVRYEAAVVKRTPANIANLRMILGILFGAQAKETSCLDIASADSILWGAGRIDNIGLPSDISIAGYSVDPDHVVTDDERSQKQIGTTAAYSDEQLYWWDASIGIPVHKIKDLQYSNSNNTVTASQVDKQSAYAMFNLMLHPVDLSDSSYNVWPRILVGFPLASSPWDKLFAGGAIGLPLKPFKDFQFFAGATFIRDKQPATLAAGSSATAAQLQNDLRIKTTPKFTFGINVPVKSVIDKLK